MIKWIDSNLPGITGKIIESNPQFIYEGCSKEGNIPWLYQIARFIKRLFK